MNKRLPAAFTRMLACGLVLLLGSTLRATAQKRYWHRWQYQTAGVDFTAGRLPVPYVPATPSGGPAQIADSTGTISELFVDGVTTHFALTNRNGTRLPNGPYLPFGVLRDGLLVPWPRHPEYTLCFYVREAAGIVDLRYAFVDRRLRGGLGDVSLRGFQYWQTDSVSPQLHQQAREGLALVPHANGRDYWVITTTTTGLNTYLVSPHGVSRQPLQSPLLTPQVAPQSGDYPTVVRPTTRGNGFIVERIVADAAGEPLNRVEYYPFDTRTGQVAAGRLLLVNINVASNGRFVRGFTPSPNGRRVYAVGGDSTKQELVQFDLTAPDSATFRASRQPVYVEAVGPGFTGTWTPLTPMRAGPNGKFYLLFNSDTLSVINCPDAPAAQCGFQRNGLVVPGAGGNVISPSDHIPAAFYFLPGFTLQNAPLGSLCQGQPLTVSLNNAPYLDSARWQFGDGAAGAGLAPLTHLYTQPGTYRVLVRVWYNGCSTDTLSQLVTVRPAPRLQLPADTVVCGTGKVVLTPRGLSADITRYQWSTGATTTTLSVAQPGTYTLTVTNATGCTSTAQTRVVFPPLPILHLPTDTASCGSALLLRPRQVSADVVAYRWNTGATTPTLSVATAGTYTLTVTTAAGCQAVATVRVTFPTLPTLRLPTDTLTCAGTSLLLRPGGLSAGITSYRWSTGAITPTLSVSQPGTYTLTVTNAAGCQATATAQVRVAPLPTLRLPADTVQCANGPARLLRPMVSADVVAYRWSTGAITPTLSVSQPGTYTLTVTTAAGCATTARTVLAPAPVPARLLGPDTTACLGTVVRLQVRAGQPVLAVRWRDGSTGPTYAVTATGTYTAGITLAGGCQYQAQVQVIFDECPNSLIIPNIITPNGDHLNDAFVVPGLASGVWRLEVYSRWGRAVYDQAGYTNGNWDGAGLSAGSYYYRLSRPGYQLKGWVEIVR